MQQVHPCNSLKDMNQPEHTEDHRVRVAAARRERMRSRLIDSALQVFASQGLDATPIEDVIAYAQVSRGTFYNYFKTNEELFAAVLEAINNELLALVDATILPRPDPAERLACGVRLVLHTARAYPLFAKFSSRVSLEQAARNNLAMEYVPRDLRQGVEQGRFALTELRLGLDMVVGMTRLAMFSMLAVPPVAATYPEQATEVILLGLGMDKAEAMRLAHLPLEAVILPPESLLARSGQLPTATTSTPSP
jgi:AcrR family transcriptional regulator